MLLKNLGCAGSPAPGNHSPAFLLDGTLLLDAGTIGAVLSETEQAAIRTILVTHSHLDHVKGIGQLADSKLLSRTMEPVAVVSTKAILQVLRDNIFNFKVWPDFSLLPSPAEGILRWLPIESEQEMLLDGFAVTAIEVNHSVPAVGYRVSRGASSLLYTGDTGPTRRIWELAGDLTGLIVEVSFPNEMEEFSIRTGHLTPNLLAQELKKLDRVPDFIQVVHLKHHFADRIREELDRLGMSQLRVAEEGVEFNL